MIVRRGGQHKTIDSSEYGIYLAEGYVKVAEGTIGDYTPKEEKAKREELPKLTIEEIHNTDKFVKLDEAKESVTPPHGESEVIPELDKDGCYGGVCGDNIEADKQEEKETKKNNKRRNK